MHSVAWVAVSVSDEPAHVEAEGEEAGPQQVTHSSQVGDGEVVRVQTPSPHHTDDEVGDVKEDGHLDGEDKLRLEKTKVDIMGKYTKQ